MTSLKPINPIITDTIHTLTTQMGPITWTPNGDTHDLHLLHQLNWQETNDSITNPATSMTIPAASEEGEPKLVRITNPGPGGMTIDVGTFPKADDDLKTAFYNLIVGFLN